jgi:hypothetical protein
VQPRRGSDTSRVPPDRPGADGEAVVARPPSTLANPKADLPKFRANMTPFEVAELLAATLT